MKKIVIANFYPIWPVVGGGQRRIFFLARELSRRFKVELITVSREQTSTSIQFSPNFKEVRIAADKAFRWHEVRLDNEVKMAADLCYAMHWKECKKYQKVLARSLETADIAVTAHPYSIYALLDARSDHELPIVFDSQNVELHQKASVLEAHPHYVEEIRKIENAALSDSDAVLACSMSDAESFGAEYGANVSKIGIIENGVDALGVPRPSGDIKGRARKELGLSDELVAIFAGSYHYPNFNAVDYVLEIAPKLPNVLFVFLGSICNYPPLGSSKLDNVRLLGAVDEDTKWMMYGLSDIGLNPMRIGSGTNIKMFEYAASALPVLSTPFGARGVGLENNKECIICPIEQFEGELRRISTVGGETLQQMGDDARQKVCKVSDWSVIGRKYVKCFEELC